MAKERLCTNCTYNNNGWCTVRKTNKDLKDLLECEYKKINSIVKLEKYLEQKEFEVKMENTSYNRGLIKGLEIALKIISET